MRYATLLLSCGLLCAQTKKSTLEIPGGTSWLETKATVKAGDTLKFKAEGTLTYPQSPPSGPKGLPRGWKDLLRQFPLANGGRGALIGRIGESAQPFLIGDQATLQAPVGGKLWIGVNQAANEKPEGSYKVNIEVAAGKALPPVDVSKLPKVTQEMLDKIPTRVVDAQGTPGDRTNFLVIGTEEQVKEALQRAGWVIVDRTKQDAVVSALLATLTKEAYLKMPMSELLVFDRVQDYGYAKGEAIKVVAERHHFRLWKAPFDVEGQTLWIGAGTHDVGFDKDQRNNGVTHRIDSNTDLEREYIGKNFQETGAVAQLSYLTPSNPVTKANTAHGQEFTSDGRTLIIHLRPDWPPKP
jgi:hypothetical protein